MERLNKTPLLLITTFLILFLHGNAWGEEENPLPLPKVEGSKSFDLEIDQLNHKGIKLFHEDRFQEAGDQFKKSLDLARQLRDPSQGLLHYNLALSLHKSGNRAEAAKHFQSAKKYARGNSTILNSTLLKKNESGINR